MTFWTEKRKGERHNACGIKTIGAELSLDIAAFF